MPRTSGHPTTGAKADFKWLVDHPKAAGVYQNWQTLADRFTHLYSTQPAGPYAAASLLWASRIHQGAWKRFHRDQDFHKAVDVLRRLISHFPESRLADDAQFKIGELYEAKGEYKQAYLEYLKVTTNHPQGDQVGKGQERAGRTGADHPLRPRGPGGKGRDPKSRSQGGPGIRRHLGSGLPNSSTGPRPATPGWCWGLKGRCPTPPSFCARTRPFTNPAGSTWTCAGPG